MSGFNVNDLVPFLNGLVVQLVGSSAQYWAIQSRQRAGELKKPTGQQVWRDGDAVQLVATAAAVIPAAVLLLRSHLVFLIIIILVMPTVYLITVLKVWHMQEGTYDRKTKFKIFSPACLVSLLLCLTGMTASILIQP